MKQKNVPKYDTWTEIDLLIQEVIAQQEKVLLETARRLIPHVTSEDLLQPNDFQELEFEPNFRYEEGVLAGMKTVEMALRALGTQKSSVKHPRENLSN
jgi:hypothetical protein